MKLKKSELLTLKGGDQVLGYKIYCATTDGVYWDDWAPSSMEDCHSAYAACAAIKVLLGIGYPITVANCMAV